ncbi:hypothetical protein SS05631_b60830 (plasmid) [Sinorhizobium sp. CCBAU 05631]|nr:hypothetical protein SS05631_b60830 [Sinorhizobium sp. CCBAU 05631]
MAATLFLPKLGDDWLPRNFRPVDAVLVSCRSRSIKENE